MTDYNEQENPVELFIDELEDLVNSLFETQEIEEEHQKWIEEIEKEMEWEEDDMPPEPPLWFPEDES